MAVVALNSFKQHTPVGRRGTPARSIPATVNFFTQLLHPLQKNILKCPVLCKSKVWYNLRREVIS
jgi:hypothetical protein